MPRAAFLGSPALFTSRQQRTPSALSGARGIRLRTRSRPRAPLSGGREGAVRSAGHHQVPARTPRTRCGARCRIERAPRPRHAVAELAAGQAGERASRQAPASWDNHLNSSVQHLEGGRCPRTFLCHGHEAQSRHATHSLRDERVTTKPRTGHSPGRVRDRTDDRPEVRQSRKP